MKIITVLFIFFTGLSIAGNTDCSKFSPVDSRSMVIDPADTVIFDLSHATITATYIDIPVSFKSDDIVNALDFAFKFDETKFTYDSIINYKSYLLSLANFNPIDRFLRFTSSSLATIENDTRLIAIRFNIAAPCITITSADFNSIAVYLNGDPCTYKIKGSAEFKPFAGFTNTRPCVNTTVNFTDLSTTAVGDSITSWSWDFGNGNTSILKNPSTVYTSIGGYDVSLIIGSGISCKDTISKHVFVNPVPVAGFTSVFNCTVDSVFFTNTSLISSGTITNWNWAFGDGESSSLQNPSHNYATAGSFSILLTATSDSLCNSTFLDTILLNKPVANFSGLNGCSGTSLDFTDSTTTSSGTITSWSWNFGDGHTSTLQNPSNTFISSGTYIVNLTVTSSSGCISNVSKTVLISDLPVVKFAGNDLLGCGPLIVNFTDSSTVATGATYFWRFGDGATSLIQNPIHSYTEGGNYSVTLIVTNPGGCIDSLVKNTYIHVIPSPVANFSPSNGCIGTSVNFMDASTISSGTITDWNWNFGDGTNSILKNPAKEYANAGFYNVALIVLSNLGCTDTVTKLMTIDSLPVVKFDADILSGCSPLEVNFSDSSVAAIGSTYFWNFGDGITSSLKNPVHTYVSGGDYTVKHYVTTPGGCADSLVESNYIHVDSSPAASFSASPGVVTIFDATVAFTNLSSNYITSAWNFGDSAVSDLNSPAHTFTDTGRYVVCLIVKNAAGCSASYCNDVQVIGSTPIAVPAAFSPNGDGSNDVLKVRGGPLSDMEFRIFNEWGNLIFSSNKQEEGWDGNYNGVQQPVGFYEYTLKGKTADNKSINIYDVVNLIR